MSSTLPLKPSLKLTAKAPENGCLEYIHSPFLLGVNGPIFFWGTLAVSSFREGGVKPPTRDILRSPNWSILTLTVPPQLEDQKMWKCLKLVKAWTTKSKMPWFLGKWCKHPKCNDFFLEILNLCQHRGDRSLKINLALGVGSCMWSAWKAKYSTSAPGSWKKTKVQAASP